MGSSGLARLQGLFAVYKPPGLKWLHLRETVELQLLKGLNASAKPPAPEQRVRFLLGPVEGSEEKKLTLTATSVPTLTTHRLVRGPAFTSLKIGVGHRLDAQASGVLDHVTRERLDRILAIIQGSHQKALVMYSNLDLKSQEAYEMAVQGVIRPMNKSPMLISGIRCLHFAPPEFLLEVQCMHETQQQLRRLVHEIGLELRTTAVCVQVRRTRDGFFRLDDALLRTQWDLHSIQDAIQAAAPRVAAELKKNLRLRLGHQQLPSAGQPCGFKDPSSTLGVESSVGQ
ncbi:pseudouridylate synthase TRUB2, mitochondrial isoform X2 [Peromyscus californicus insignis]|uniref:pseudouridylate synthase TRUB2, mitochondrial isoform X2 n=1 Tax=Peromyscus californicus insignis TaxID=564181 RepID=UPI0022A711FF|nr:pseudouridylate synthase TRUB2, mitochondrial isoform X2 [Peromyscus californicus insignis]